MGHWALGVGHGEQRDFVSRGDKEISVLMDIEVVKNTLYFGILICCYLLVAIDYFNF
jgi:hypothetical protein